MRKSKVTKVISRKINTGPYETLSVSVGSEEEIEWETLDERARKTENVTKVVTDDFNKTLEKVMEELKVAKKSASINIPKPGTMTENKSEESTKVSGSKVSINNFDEL